MLKSKFHCMLHEKKQLILDGGFATTLEMMGHTLDKRYSLIHYQTL
jgi:S-methylmethionine-dependent homocysteine/selenocysteine methylase